MGISSRMRLLAAASSCAAVMFSVAASAQVTPPMEYGKYVERGSAIQPLGDSPFGEQIGLYDGSISFSHTDFELPGIGPTIRIIRTFHITRQNENVENSGIGFLDWELEVPRIKTVVANHLSGNYSVEGWVVTPMWRGNDAYKRCTWFRQPPLIDYEGDAFAKEWEPDEWWNGYFLIGLDGQSQKLLQGGTDPPAPTGYGMTFPLTTKERWKVGCLANTANGEPGEAFLAVSPDGTRYWFNYLTYSEGVPLVRDDGRPLERSNAAMFVTRIEDRFGNYLTYNYQGHSLASITASDGRQVTFTSTAPAKINTITIQGSQPRTWTYQYDVYDQYGTPRLGGVVNPDGSSWRFNLVAMTFMPEIRPYGATCDLAGDAGGSSGASEPIGSITAPSGLTAAFAFDVKKHGRSYVWRQCWGAESDGNGGWTESYAYFPRTWFGLSLTKMIVSGPGVPARTWQYAYSPANESWEQDCINGASCPTTVWTDVIEPDGVRERHFFSNRYGPTEGLEVRSERYASNTNTVKRIVSNTYAVREGTAPWPYPWPEFIGSTMLQRDNPYPSVTPAPLNKQQIEQDGMKFIWQANAYDSLARPTSITKSSAVSP